MKTVLGVLAAIVVALLLIVYAAGRGVFGSHEGPGKPAAKARPEAVVNARSAAVADAARAVGVYHPKQILFGDLHVHTTFSPDAFMLSLPIIGGEGAHPPADACDFARYCSALDFWSITDHAFGITPQHWHETVDAIRECNAVAGDPKNPDLVSFLGWEWTQVGTTAKNHYGHKNVVLRDLSDDAIPARPIAALRGSMLGVGTMELGAFALARGGRIHELAKYLEELRDTPRCPTGVPERKMPANCLEGAATPAELFAKLDDWGVASIVIPHGTTWGFYTPPGSSWDKQLVGAMHDPSRQRLIEVYSGHGTSEVYRDWRAVNFDANGKPVCPEPRADYLPSCWRAGEIIRARCLAAGETAKECESRAVEARANAAAAGVAGHLTVPGAKAEEWLDAGQCRDCDQPAFNYRPASSAQYITAIGNFDEAKPRHFRLGFIASSDNHFARPSDGYKEVHRLGFTESRSLGADQHNPVAEAFRGKPEKPEPRSRPYELGQPGFNVFETERQASFFLTGGLVAVHSAGRDRDAIFDALERREVYGTTGTRILLWFDLLNPPGSRGQTVPMGGEATMGDAPIFQVRAVGSFRQKPGCPRESEQALGPEELARICKDECYNPSDQRLPITRIEVVRIRPQDKPGEDVKNLIDDPWRTFTCDPDPAGCAVTFTDADFPGVGRGTAYYVRAFEPEKPGINAGGLRCDRDASGQCTKVHMCPGPDGAKDDCLSPFEPRAWSSPIWVDPAPAPPAAAGAAAVAPS